MYYDGSWKVFDISSVIKSSNHPYIEIIDGLPKVRTNHANNYTVGLEIRRHYAPNSNINFMGYMGLDYVAEHTHNAADINVGVLAIARIPTGTTNSTVVIGNDSRVNNGQTAFG